jgi:hypothetical protein
VLKGVIYLKQATRISNVLLAVLRTSVLAFPYRNKSVVANKYQKHSYKENQQVRSMFFVQS